MSANNHGRMQRLWVQRISLSGSGRWIQVHVLKRMSGRSRALWYIIIPARDNCYDGDVASAWPSYASHYTDAHIPQLLQR